MTSTYVGKMNDIKPIDSHVHFCKFDDDLDYPAWFNDQSKLKQDYLPCHLGPELSAISAEGALVVGTAHSAHNHNLEWGNMCEKNRIVMALIGNYRLDSAHLCELLDTPTNHGLLVFAANRKSQQETPTTAPILTAVRKN